ncbi:hypothetical protein NBRC116594_14220 [Shimia sp. NS0008-38b]|uniref:hypothetical protein n=1 Tax=Shimia sp. NS0008-38b TaxID=3127653 RepID=UPI003103E1CD
MKLSLSIITSLAFAAPAFAHVEGHFHTHGAESFLILAGIAAVVAVLAFRR